MLAWLMGIVGEALVAIVAIIAGIVASVTGFGIGSLLTPTLAVWFDTKLAVAAVSIPHFVGTALRFWLVKEHVDRRVMWSFGLASAAGGLAGALLHSWASNPWLMRVFGAVLLFVAVSELTGLSGRMKFKGPVAWIAGALSGLLGGLVGNQGGIRSGALLGFPMRKEAFVATATAIGLFVDAARMPVYVVTQGREMLDVWPLMIIASVGVVVGTLVGKRVLSWIPEPWFRRIVAVLLAILGGSMFYKAAAD